MRGVRGVSNVRTSCASGASEGRQGAHCGSSPWRQFAVGVWSRAREGTRTVRSGERSRRLLAGRERLAPSLPFHAVRAHLHGTMAHVFMTHAPRRPRTAGAAPTARAAPRETTRRRTQRTRGDRACVTAKKQRPPIAPPPLRREPQRCRSSDRVETTRTSAAHEPMAPRRRRRRRAEPPRAPPPRGARRTLRRPETSIANLCGCIAFHSHVTPRYTHTHTHTYPPRPRDDNTSTAKPRPPSPSSIVVVGVGVAPETRATDRRGGRRGRDSAAHTELVTRQLRSHCHAVAEGRPR